MSFVKALIDAQAVALLVQMVTGAIITSPSTVDCSLGGLPLSRDATANEANVFPVLMNEGIVALMILCTGIYRLPDLRSSFSQHCIRHRYIQV